jgi:hypothetical protein
MADLAMILASVMVVSLVAFVGIIFVGLKEAFLKRILMALVGFASGSLIGGAFIHLLPEAVEKTGQGIFYYAIAGIYFFTSILRTPLVARPTTKVTPINPPIMPPITCSPTQPRTPPHLVKAGATMKNVPMIKPATAADSTETESIETVTNNGFLKHLSYPMSFAVTSKTTLAAAKPRK